MSLMASTSFAYFIFPPRHQVSRLEFPTITVNSMRRRAPVTLATSEDNSASESTLDSPPKQDKKVQAKEEAQQGQTTALVTGGIAVLLGVAYLILVQLLDSRGVNLVPPPPEALNQ